MPSWKFYCNFDAYKFISACRWCEFAEFKFYNQVRFLRAYDLERRVQDLGSRTLLEFKSLLKIIFTKHIPIGHLIFNCLQSSRMFWSYNESLKRSVW